MCIEDKIIWIFVLVGIRIIITKKKEKSEDNMNTNITIYFSIISIKKLLKIAFCLIKFENF